MKENESVNRFIQELNEQNVDNFNIPLLDKLGENNMLEICKFVLESGDFQTRNNLTIFLNKSTLNLQKELN